MFFGIAGFGVGFPTSNHMKNPSRDATNSGVSFVWALFWPKKTKRSHHVMEGFCSEKHCLLYNSKIISCTARHY